jgi:hypothetical protein
MFRNKKPWCSYTHKTTKLHRSEGYIYKQAWIPCCKFCAQTEAYPFFTKGPKLPTI